MTPTKRAALYLALICCSAVMGLSVFAVAYL